MGTLTQDLTNLSEVITSVTGWITDIMGVFMEAPLIIFVGLAIAVVVVRVVKRLLRPR